MKIATRNEIRKIDEQSIKRYLVPGIILMENAGRSTAEVIASEYPDVREISVFCGSGNNGGDGFVIARHLINTHHKIITIYLCTDENKIKGDSYTNFLTLKNLKCEIKKISNDFSNYRNCELIIDALFGTGLDRKISGFYKNIIDFINNQNRTIVSVDIPSGLDSDTGRPLGTCIKADITVTYGLPKIGMCIYPGLDYCGRVFLSSITTPRALEEKLMSELLTADDINNILRARQDDTHKGTYGHLLILSGSPGKTGAATLAALGSQRIGTGLTTVGIPQSLNPIIEQKLTEAMTYPVSETKDGTFGETSIKETLELISDKKSAIALGPGISVSRHTEKFLYGILNEISIPTIFDADAISLLSKRPEILKEITYPVVLTPHPGEMSRLMGKSIIDIQENRIKISMDFASQYNVYLVLKGARTIIATPDHKIYINTTGNSGMATGGMGDVLTGIIGGLLAQGYSAEDSCRIGVYIHGIAGDLASEKVSIYGYLASELADLIPESLNVLKSGKLGVPIIRVY